ncbi:hypothetical protein [Parafrigoribacterium soli]|uniref:hypothetical protein n=1 Tax=Parafrigoribacterium soli TaxID=3144663 RepID=UPI0032EAC110
MFLLAEALTESDPDAVAVIREAEAIVVDALFDDVARSLTVTAVAPAPGRGLPERTAAAIGASYYRHPRDDRTSAFFWARSPPLVAGA